MSFFQMEMDFPTMDPSSIRVSYAAGRSVFRQGAGRLDKGRGGRRPPASRPASLDSLKGIKNSSVLIADKKLGVHRLATWKAKGVNVHTL